MKETKPSFSSNDLCVLKGPYYISDSIIDFYFNRLSSSDDVLLVSPTVSFWLANCCDDPDTIKDFLEPLNLSSKKLVLFPVNNSTTDQAGSSRGGAHWSLLVYSRTMNAFVHHDSSRHGLNYWSAVQLYDVVKEHVKRQPCNNKKTSDDSLSDATSPPAEAASECKKKKRRKRRNREVPEAIFVEGRTPQQTNGYDCGLYVMAIAKAICQWYADSNKKHDEWFSRVNEEVHASLEKSMRADVLKLITDEAILV